jgi:hypothetical protein
LIDRFILRKSKEELSKYYYTDVNLDSKRQYVKMKKCEACSMTNICDGLKKQYFNRFGDDELSPYNGETLMDPTYFIKEQFKIED